jgi:hypothetical protein
VKVTRSGAGQEMLGACEGGPHTSFATIADQGTPQVEHLYHNSNVVGDTMYTLGGVRPTIVGQKGSTNKLAS